jgi:hypothetical protein
MWSSTALRSAKGRGEPLVNPIAHAEIAPAFDLGIIDLTQSGTICGELHALEHYQ